MSDDHDDTFEWAGLRLFEYEATSPAGHFLGTGVTEARDAYTAYDLVRSFFGVRARIVLKEVKPDDTV
jgi:hypothetical protein